MVPMSSDSSTTAVPTQKRRLAMAFILGSLTALAPLSIDMYLPALPSLANNMHASTSVTELSLTFCLLGLAFGQLIAGPISDAHGRRRPLLIGLLIYTAASLVCAFTASIWLLIGLRFIEGLAGSAGIVIARAVARDFYSGTELTKFFALLMLVNGSAPILAPVFGGQLLRFTSWNGVFIVLGLLGFGMVTAVFFGLPESLAAPERAAGGIRKTLSTFRGFTTDRAFMGYAGAQGLVFAAMFGYISGSPFVLQKIFLVSPQMFSVIFATNGLGIIVASQLSARLSVRLGESKVLTAGLVLAGAAGITLFTVLVCHASLVLVLPPLFISVACVGVVGTTCTSLAMQSKREAAGSAAGLLGVTQMLLGAAASPLVGLFGSQKAWPMGTVIAICDMAGLICYFILVKLYHEARHKAFVR